VWASLLSNVPPLVLVGDAVGCSVGDAIGCSVGEVETPGVTGTLEASLLLVGDTVGAIEVPAVSL
jgi:hypothetical protein